jgi:transposase
MSYYAGIDLHSNNAYLAVIDENRTVAFKKRLPNNLNMITHHLEPFKSELNGVVVESTFNGYWLIDGLQDHQHTVRLANPCACQQYSGLKHSNDKTDAIWLADMLRLGTLPTGHIYPRAQRGLRDLLRRRTLIMKNRCSLLISLRGFIHNWSGANLSRLKIKSIDASELKPLINEEFTLEAAKSFKRLIASFDDEIQKIEDLVFKQVKAQSTYKHLTSVWGIGPFLAALITLETGDIHRFSDAGRYASYCRCVSSQKVSNDKTKGSGNKRNGNRYLAWAFMEAAFHARCHYDKARSWFDKKNAKRGYMIASKALSNKIARATFYVMRDQTPFYPEKLFA